MASNEQAHTPLLGPGTHSVAGQRSISVGETGVAALAGIGLTCAWTLWVGQDLSADLLNHHVYLPYSLLTGRYATDLFAAGPQSYQNPIGYLPFFWMLQAGWPAWAVGLVLAALHGLVLAPVASIGLTVWGPGTEARWWRRLSLALAWVSPVFLLGAGSSSVDPICQLLIMVALACALSPGADLRRSLFGGAMLGLAFAIKPTNAVFALAIGAVLAWRLYTRQTRWAQAGTLVGCAVAAAVAGMGFWTYWLWSTFDNPVFPLFNQAFRSPFAPQQPVVALRFLPETFSDWLTRPWEMAAMQRFSTTEAYVPDLRPAALLVTCLLAAPWLAMRRPALAWRGPVAQLGLFAIVGYLLWMQTSGNSRYAMPLLAVVAVLLVAAARAVLPARPARIALGTLLVLHAANYVLVGEHRMAARPWSNGPFLDFEIPKRLRDEPFLHLSIGVQSTAAVAPQLHPAGALINVVGQLSLPTTGPLGDELRKRLALWRGRTRFLFSHHEGPETMRTLPEPKLRLRVDRIIEHLPLRIDWSDCEALSVGLMPVDGVVQRTSLLSCAAIPGAPLDDSRIADRSRADRTFLAIEHRCPRVYGPSPFVSHAGNGVWQRHYANSDVRVTITAEDEVLATHFRSMKVILLGKVSDILSGGGADPCEVWKLLKKS